MLTIVTATQDFPLCGDVCDSLEKLTPVLGFPNALVLADSGSSKDGRLMVYYFQCHRSVDGGIDLFEIKRKDNICLEGNCAFLLSGITGISGLDLIGDLFIRQVYERRKPQPGCEFRLVRFSYGQEVGLFTLDERYRAR